MFQSGSGEMFPGSEGVTGAGDEGRSAGGLTLDIRRCWHVSVTLALSVHVALGECRQEMLKVSACQCHTLPPKLHNKCCGESNHMRNFAPLPSK